MSNKYKSKIAFIIEGIKTEPIVIRNLKNKFFDKTEIEAIMLPTCTNIYAIWKKICDDEEETDIIELVKELSSKQTTKRVDQINHPFNFRELNRDDFSEIYLFFDYDGHNNNLPSDCDHNEIMRQMLMTFDNETENGKMYISYPMIEAIKHFNEQNICDQEIDCFSKIVIGKKYKSLVADCTARDNLNKFDIKDWKFAIKKYMSSIYCLFDLEGNISRKEYLEKITPIAIFDRQLNEYVNVYDYVMILSAFPEFIMDYFKLETLEEYLECTKLLNNEHNCDCKKIENIKNKELVTV
ncbi:hypothetical protein [Thomasclavelia spiroformis]|jgi:hypothetical protein|uniref:hypothetical protein n=1 Tax=Thomasclavelia spiroformis TaxID=29348 RepID=UPI00241C2E2B|nr:hypothetical protein [Thomasclavelia spiroformis]